MYSHPKLVLFTQTLEALFREVDEELEERWAGSFSLHPNRPARGATANPEMDGLFEIAPDFTPGIGSEKGRGYLISLRVATLEQVPASRLEAFMEEAAALVREKLPRFFPGRSLEVVRDRGGGPESREGFKIVGDFSLGGT
jgi:hypothetical protein